MRIEKLSPAFKDYIWGGVKLKEKFGKRTDCTPCAESWELSFHRDGETRLSDGRRLADGLSPEELGDNVEDFEFFPMLVKFIDANDNLSIQVHPTDRFALANENSYGKTELWYIVDADEGAGLYIGFKNEVTRSEFESAIRKDRLPELLNFVTVKRGERYFIPAPSTRSVAAASSARSSRTATSPTASTISDVSAPTADPASFTSTARSRYPASHHTCPPSPIFPATKEK